MKLAHLGAMAFALAAPLASNAAMAAPDDDIVVSAEASQVRAEAQRFVADVSKSAGDQLARFHHAICPEVVGLPEDRARAVEERVMQIAREVGAPVGEPGCQGNILVIAADDLPAVYRQIEKDRPELLRGVERNQRRELERAKGPVMAWGRATLRDEDGALLETNQDTGQKSSSNVKSATIIGLPRKQHLEWTVILIERQALLDRSLLQFADFVAVQGLAMVEPPSESSLGTVLSAFSKRNQDAPESLTPADFAFLKALYASKGTMKAVVERGRIADSIARFDVNEYTSIR